MRLGINGKSLTKPYANAVKSALDLHTRLTLGQFSSLAHYVVDVLEPHVDLLRLYSIKDNLMECHKILHGKEASWGFDRPEISLDGKRVALVDHVLHDNLRMAKQLQDLINQQVIAEGLEVETKIFEN